MSTWQVFARCCSHSLSVCVCMCTPGARSKVMPLLVLLLWLFVLQHSVCLPPRETGRLLQRVSTKDQPPFEVLKTSIYASPRMKKEGGEKKKHTHTPSPFESGSDTSRHCGHASRALISQILKPVCGEQDLRG